MRKKQQTTGKTSPEEITAAVTDEQARQGLLDSAYVIGALELVDGIPTVTTYGVVSIVVDVPTDVSREDLKHIIELAGKAPGPDGRPWQGYALIPYNDRSKYAVEESSYTIYVGKDGEWTQEEDGESYAVEVKNNADDFWNREIDRLLESLDNLDTYWIGYSQLCSEIKSEKRITLRMHLGLHSFLAALADREGVSLNELCVRKLYESLPPASREIYKALDGLIATVGIDEAQGLVSEVLKGNNPNG
jgi:hypothetical protein